MQVAVHDLCLGIPAGQRFGFLGPNGAGKTTTLSILSGDQQATSGDALVAGQSLVHSSGASPRGALLGYCPQQVDTPPCLSKYKCYAEMNPSSPSSSAAMLDSAVLWESFAGSLVILANLLVCCPREPPLLAFFAMCDMCL